MAPHVPFWTDGLGGADAGSFRPRPGVGPVSGLLTLRPCYEKEYGTQIDTEICEKTAPSMPNMISYVYCNIGDDTFSTIKKLKTLAASANEAEGFAAYRKCVEMCRKYNLEFDKIPTN